MFKKMEGDREVMIYVCGRRMPQPLSSSLWQPRANALIRLPADCRGGKNNAIIVHHVRLWAPELTAREGASYTPCFIVPASPHRQDRQL